MKKFLLICAVLMAQMAYAERLEVTITQLPQQTAAPIIDGNVNDAAWQLASPVSLDIQTNPEENGPAPVATQARLIASADTLYVQFLASDPKPEAIRAHLTDRDNVWDDDIVGIKLETFDQGRLAYQFFVNSLGVQSDSIENELTGRESDAWDGIWYSASKITPQGYQVEIALPLRLFTFDDNQQLQRWGIELVRYYPRTHRYRLAATPVDRNISCRLCQMGVAVGLEGAKPGQQLQIVPGLTAARNEQRDSADEPWQRNDDIEPSLDLRWGITPDTLLNATINPDFSQVEADTGQLDVNTTFALFFPEKRPFYLDNADFFESRINIINTRNLAEPDFGAKVTGQRGQHLFGLLHTQDAQTNFLVPGNLSSQIADLNQTSQNLAGRYLYDGANGLSVGSSITHRQGDDYHNTVVGIDGQWQINDNHRLRATALGSDTQYPQWLADDFCDGDECALPPTQPCEFGDCDYNEQVLRSADSNSFQGSLLKLNYYFDSRHYQAWADYYRVDEDFRADLGFVDRVDFAKTVLGAARTWYFDDRFLYEIELSGDVDRSENIAGEKLEQEVEAQLNGYGSNEFYIELYGGLRERAGRREDASSLAIKGNAPLFNEHWYGVYGELRPTASVKFGLNARAADEIDFSNNQLGELVQINGWINWKPSRGINTTFRHTWRTMNVSDGELFTANLTDFRFHWQFNVRSFIRASAILTDIERDPEQYRYNQVDRQSRYLSSEILYGYKVNPLTVFYLGYGDGRFSDDDTPSLEQDSRTLFAKLSYAFLL